MLVDLAKNAKGAWIGSFSMPEFGANGIPIDQLSVTQNKVHFVAPAPGSPAFDGEVSADGKELAGTFSDAHTKAPLTLKRIGAPQVKELPPNSPLTKDFEGTWHGILNAGDTQIRILLKLTRTPDGTASGVLVNVDQGNREAPITTIQLKDKVLDFELRAQAVHYHGTLNGTGTIVGEWSQLSRSAALNFERGPFPPNSPLTKAFEGTWLANMDAGVEMKLVLGLTLTRASDGSAVGMLKNVSDSGKELPVTTIALKDKHIAFLVPGLNASFNGMLNNAGTEFSGNWVQVSTAIPLVFKHQTGAEKKP